MNAEDAPMFAAVLAELDAPSDPSEATPDDSVEIILGDLTVRIGSGVSPQRVAALVSALRSVS